MNTEKLNKQLKKELNKRVFNINFEKVIELINQGANVNLQSDYCFHNTALHYAIHNRKLEELLLNAGVNINIRDKYECTALHYASNIKDNEKTVELLLNADANVNLQNNYGKAPLLEIP